MQYLIYIFLSLNVFSFIITAFDKVLAIKKHKRISEKWLLMLVAFGGTIGALLAMLIFRHKTSKKSYLWKFWGIVLFQFLPVFLLFYYQLFKL